MDGQTDRRTDPRCAIFKLDQDLTQTNIQTKFESSLQKSIPVIAAQCSIRERNVKNPKKLPVTLMTPKTIGVLLIWYITHIQSLKYTKKVWTDRRIDRRTDGQTDGWTDGWTDNVITIGHPHFSAEPLIIISLWQIMLLVQGWVICLMV